MPKIQEFITQNLLYAIKISTLVLGVLYIINKLSESLNEINFSSLSLSVLDILNISLTLIILSLLNWYGELKKWKTLAQLPSFYKVVQQVFISHSLSILTPNKFGEYGGKCMFYSKDKSHQIIALTGIGHFCQLTATVSFGIIGFLYLPDLSLFNIEYSSFWIIAGFLIGLGFLFSHKLIKHHLNIIFDNIRQVEQKLFIKTLLWSFFRYLMFAHQFMLLLWLFGAQLNYSDGMAVIFLIYVLSSVIPSFAISDVLIKGSIAISLLSLFGVQLNLVLTVILLMWMFNTMLPALLGYILLLRWKPKLQFLKK